MRRRTRSAAAGGASGLPAAARTRWWARRRCCRRGAPAPGAAHPRPTASATVPGPAAGTPRQTPALHSLSIGGPRQQPCRCATLYSDAAAGLSAKWVSLEPGPRWTSRVKQQLSSGCPRWQASGATGGAPGEIWQRRRCIALPWRRAVADAERIVAHAAARAPGERLRNDQEGMDVMSDAPSLSSVYACRRLAHVHEQHRSHHPTGPRRRDNGVRLWRVLLVYEQHEWCQDTTCRAAGGAMAGRRKPRLLTDVGQRCGGHGVRHAFLHPGAWLCAAALAAGGSVTW